jgi:hypothetical protein
VDASDNVYVADTGNLRIQEFDNVGNYLYQWKNSGPGFFNNPIFISVAPSGNLYVLDPDVIKIFAP